MLYIILDIGPIYSLVLLSNWQAWMIMSLIALLLPTSLNMWLAQEKSGLYIFFFSKYLQTFLIVLGPSGVTSIFSKTRKLVSMGLPAVSYTHLRAHETVLDLVC